jgi:phospholipid-binding lipoprotein MlaA
MPKQMGWILAAALVLPGCASTNGSQGGVSDPLEPINRPIVAFNEALDGYVLAPVARGYKAATPLPARVWVSNFFNNLGDVWTGFNNLLQAKPAEAASDVGRVLVNSTFGILGFFDVASEIGLEKHDEDFGQTLGTWGVGPGPYVELPIFGPSTLRDGVSRFAVDRFGDPLRYEPENIAVRNGLNVLRVVDGRQQVLGLEKTLDDAAADTYTFRRNFFLRKREADVNDGKRKRRDDDFLE